jgi:hypothetical protein
VIAVKDLRCLVGLHHWKHHVNHEMGGSGGGYDLCTRCRREKKAYGKPPATGVAGPGGF